MTMGKGIDLTGKVERQVVIVHHLLLRAAPVLQICLRYCAVLTSLYEFSSVLSNMSLLYDGSKGNNTSNWK